MKKVVVATSSLQAGTPLTPENVKLMDWPKNIPLAGSFETVEAVKGKVLMYPVESNEPVRNRFLAGQGSGQGVTAKIPDGMRAISVKTSEVANLGGFLYPGAHVDVLATLQGPNGIGAVTKTVLQNVQVLTVGKQFEPDPSAKPEDVKVVTLLVAPQDSEKLILAGSSGTIQLVLRNGADSKQVESNPVYMTELTGGPKPSVAADAAPAPAKVIRTRAPKPVAKEAFVVETVAGDKRSVAKFEQPNGSKAR